MFMNKYPESFCLHHMIQGLLNMYQIKKWELTGQSIHDIT